MSSKSLSKLVETSKSLQSLIRGTEISSVSINKENIVIHSGKPVESPGVYLFEGYQVQKLSDDILLTHWCLEDLQGVSDV